MKFCDSLTGLSGENVCGHSVVIEVWSIYGLSSGVYVLCLVEAESCPCEGSDGKRTPQKTPYKKFEFCTEFFVIFKHFCGSMLRTRIGNVQMFCSPLPFVAMRFCVYFSS